MDTSPDHPPVHPQFWALVVLGAALIGAAGYVAAAVVSRWNTAAESQGIRSDLSQQSDPMEPGPGPASHAEQELGRMRSEIGELRQELNKANEDRQTQLVSAQKEISDLKTQAESLNQQLDMTRAQLAAGSRGRTEPASAGLPITAPDGSGLRRGLIPVDGVSIEGTDVRMEITSVEYLAEEKLRVNFRYDNNSRGLIHIYGPGVRGETFLVDSAGDQYDLYEALDISNQAGRKVPAQSAVRFAVIFRAPPRGTTRLSVVLRFAGTSGWVTLSFPPIPLK